jgi:hypothetical protein
MRLVAMHRTLLCLSVFWTPSRCEVIEMSKEPVINSTGSAILISDCVDVNCFHKMSCALGEQTSGLRLWTLITRFQSMFRSTISWAENIDLFDNL